MSSIPNTAENLEMLESIINDPKSSGTQVVAAVMAADELRSAAAPQPQSTGSTPSATSEADDDTKDIRIEEVNLEQEIPESEDHRPESDGEDSAAPATFASHIFFQKGLEGGNGVNFTVTRRKGRQYIQVSQAEDEAVPVTFFRNCLDHATGVYDDCELLEIQRQKSFDDLAVGSCLGGAAIGAILLLWLWYIIAGSVQMYTRKC
jgi:hypothetical protein